MVFGAVVFSTAFELDALQASTSHPSQDLHCLCMCCMYAMWAVAPQCGLFLCVCLCASTAVLKKNLHPPTSGFCLQPDTRRWLWQLLLLWELGSLLAPLHKWVHHKPHFLPFSLFKCSSESISIRDPIREWFSLGRLRKDQQTQCAVKASGQWISFPWFHLFIYAFTHLQRFSSNFTEWDSRLTLHVHWIQCSYTQRGLRNVEGKWSSVVFCNVFAFSLHGVLLGLWR